MIPIRREFAPSDLGSFVRLWRYLRGPRFDFVQTHTPKASFLGLPAARLAGDARHLHHPRCALLRRQRPAGQCARAGASSDGAARGRPVCWCRAARTSRCCPGSASAPAAKLRYVGNGIVMDRFLAAVEPALHEELPIVMMVSRLVREKGCADFLDLARRCRAGPTSSTSGPFEHDQSDALSEEEVAAATAAGTVRFIGGVDDVRPYLASADVVVLPSYREGIPRVAMEAAAMGRPVAAYDIRGVREVIDPALGLLAPRGRRRRADRIVGDLLEDPDRRADLGKRCQRVGHRALLRGPGHRAGCGRSTATSQRQRSADGSGEGRMSTTSA